MPSPMTRHLLVTWVLRVCLLLFLSTPLVALSQPAPAAQTDTASKDTDSKVKDAPSKGDTSPAASSDASPKPESSEETPSSAEKESTEAPAPKKKSEGSFFDSLQQFLPILILLIVVAFVISRLPKIKGLSHDKAFRRRRVLNWLPLGLTYAFLYMGRYNLKISKFAFENLQGADGSAMMSNEDFGIIFGVGTVVYGFSFLINGPLTDKMGGRFAILLGAGGAIIANLLMGLATLSLIHDGPFREVIFQNFVLIFSLLYALNMYFQSFGAVSIVKVNAAWFHVRERGVFGAIFGILISLGIYFAFDWGSLILNKIGGGNDPTWVFLTPAILLALFWIADFFMVRNTPGEAGLLDFDTGDASSGDDDEELKAVEVFKLMLKNPVIMTIAFVEFCSGFLRQSIMQWFRTFAKQTDGVLGLKSSFVYENWGLLLCCAGILGGVVAGVISDHVFQSRRGPVAFVLYAVMLASAVLLTFTYDTAIVGWLVVFMSMAVIGVHGMLSGTASMDFGGKKNVGVAVGIIDGFVYLGTAVMSLTYAFALPSEEFDSAGKLIGPATDPAQWIAWPVAMIPFALGGALLATKLWNAKPKGKSTAGH